MLGCGATEEAGLAFGVALESDLDREAWANASGLVRHISITLETRNRLATAHRLALLATRLAEAIGGQVRLFAGRLSVFAIESRLGRWAESAETWRLLDPMGRAWPRWAYRQGEAEWCFARSRFWHGTLREEDLDQAAALARRDNNRPVLRELHRLRGAWRLSLDDWPGAADAFAEALRMAREHRLTDPESEAGLALAKRHLGRRPGGPADPPFPREARVQAAIARLRAERGAEG